MGIRMTCQRCGAAFIARRYKVLRGDAKYCSLRCTATKHGMTNTSEHRIWVNMRVRCSDRARGRNRANYFERGIRVCERWDKSFEAFLTDMGRRPSLQHSIDRIDNNGNYEPGNCRWATRREQVHNRRLATHCGRGHAMTDDNLYWHPQQHTRQCKQCRRLLNRESYLRARERNHPKNVNAG